jgi:hypothetical protein
MTGLGVGLGAGFCANARNGESPTAVVIVALRNPRRVAFVVALADIMANDQLTPRRLECRTAIPCGLFK